jgi:hypothetical protein
MAHHLELTQYPSQEEWLNICNELKTVILYSNKSEQIKSICKKMDISKT